MRPGVLKCAGPGYHARHRACQGPHGTPPTALNKILTDGEHIEKIAVVVGALIFFSWKAFAGYHVTNMALELSCGHQPSSTPGQDDLTVSVTLKKGDRGRVALHDCQFLVWNERHAALKAYPLHSINRWQLRRVTIDRNKRRRIEQGRQASEIPVLNLTPKDEMTLSGTARYAARDSCISRRSSSDDGMGRASRGCRSTEPRNGRARSSPCRSR